MNPFDMPREAALALAEENQAKYAPQVQSMKNLWISVEDELPEYTNPVLARSYYAFLKCVPL